MLGSPNYIERLSPRAWAELQKYCHEQALSISFENESSLCLGYFDSEKEDLLEVAGSALDDLFIDGACGKPQYNYARHQYEVVADECSHQKRWTVWDAVPFTFNVRQDDVIHSCHPFRRNDSKRFRPLLIISYTFALFHATNSRLTL